MTGPDAQSAPGAIERSVAHPVRAGGLAQLGGRAFAVGQELSEQRVGVLALGRVVGRPGKQLVGVKPRGDGIRIPDEPWRLTRRVLDEAVRERGRGRCEVVLTRRQPPVR